MRPEDSPFPCHWWGTGLEEVGLRNVRPDLDTYARYEFRRLPPLPFDLRGEFDWLEGCEPQETNIGQEREAENSRTLPALQQNLQRLNLRLPQAFEKFMRTPALRDRVRSNTDCYLDLSPAPVPSPVGDGYLVRFLNDSQGCLFWYLYLTKDGSDHAVLSSPAFFGTEEEQWRDEEPDPPELAFAAESFEGFMARFWLENEIWFAGYEKRPMPKMGLRYIEQYRSGHEPGAA